MAVDSNKKTLRHFYCRDALWQCFERMSEDFDRGIDDLVNEAMRFFAREKGYLPTENENRPSGLPASPSGQSSASLRVTPQPARPAPARSAPPPPLPAPPPPPGRATVGRPVLATPPEGAGLNGEASPPLYVLFDNKRYLVDKDQFIIGRGSKSSDLPIKDGNISRKHAAVIRKNGAYYIKDLGSTNGIDYNGQRIDNKRIEEGDVFYLCDYALRFTYR
jgi:hypothetical protein